MKKVVESQTEVVDRVNKAFEVQTKPLQESIQRIQQRIIEDFAEPMKKAQVNLTKYAEEQGRQIREAVEKFNQQIVERFSVQFKDLARLYDTFGVPRDLIRVGLEERGIDVEETIFDEAFDESLIELQQQGNIGKTQRAEKINPIYQEIYNIVGANIFHGYDKTEVEGAKVLALVKNDERVDALDVGDEGLIVLDETPFYAEAGGQVGDTGWISRESRVESQESKEESGDSRLTTLDFVKAIVLDTFAPVAGIVLHKSKVEKGTIKVGDTVTATVDVFKRDATRRNHTATHLVHAALRSSRNARQTSRFGRRAELSAVRFYALSTARRSADWRKSRIWSTAIFWKIIRSTRTKWRSKKRCVRARSLCSAKNTARRFVFFRSAAASFRANSAAERTSKRRATSAVLRLPTMKRSLPACDEIRAITGFDAFERFREDEKLIAEAVQVAKAQRDNLPTAIEKLQEEFKKVRRENDELKMKIATGAISTGASNGDEAREISGVKVIAKIVEGLDKGGMRHLSDTLLAKIKSGVIVLGRTEEDKVSFIVRVSDDLTDKIKAGKIVQEIAPIVSGRGGGKPDMAEGGGTDASKLGDALEASYKSVEQMLG